MPFVPRLLLTPIEALLRRDGRRRRRRRRVQVEAGGGVVGMGPPRSRFPPLAVVVLEQDGHRPLADLLGEAVCLAAAADGVNKE